MLNGHAGASPVAINPVQAAQFALTFLARADFKAGEREAYGIAEALLTAIASGNAGVGPPPARTATAEPPALAGGTD